jgi:IclR family mhp operon transcriptional activator
MLVRESTDHSSPLATERYSAGFRAPLLTTAAGRAYLANSPAPQRDVVIDILARSNKEEDKPARSRIELQRLLADIKSSGFATTVRTRRLAEEISLSVPVLLHDRVLASLTVRFAASAVPQKIGVERFLPKLRQSAARISALFSEQQAEARSKSTPETTA